jgi:hypothetical protein
VVKFTPAGGRMTLSAVAGGDRFFIFGPIPGG